MYFDFRTFFRLAYLSFFKWQDTPLPLTFKRVVFLTAFFTIFPLVQLFNGICFLLDDIFFPNWRKTKITKPIFIVGNPRSGTTFIHRVMARDEDRFFCFRTWELIFPAIIQKKALSLLGRIDRLAGSILSKRTKRKEQEFFNNFNRIHRIGLFSPEEDDKLLVHNFSFHGLIWFFPFDELSRFHHFDQLVKPKDRKRIMTFYKNCLKRQAFFKGADRHLLSKNPVSSLKIDSLYEYFPDCRIIYMVRNPLEVVPSTINMAHEIWSRTGKMEGGYPFQSKVYDTVKLFYNYPLSRLAQAPQYSYTMVKYEDLVRHPSQVIQAVCLHLGFQITPQFQKILEEEEERARGYISSHVYSLDQFQIPREQIISDLDHVFKRFNFSTMKNDQEKK